MRSGLKYIISVCLLFVLHSSLFTNIAFCDISEADLQDIYDGVVEDVEDEKIGFDAIDTEELEDFRTNPMDINSVNRPDLMKLPLLTPQLVVEIIRFRVKRGAFREIEELKDVPGVTDEIYRAIRPFLTVYIEEEKERIKGDVRITQRMNLPSTDKKMNAPSNFHHPEYLFGRLRFFYTDNIEVSFSAVRSDWGGCLDWENLRRYYLVSNYFYAKNYLGFDSFVLGAFKLGFDRGLTLGSVSKTISSVSKDKKGVEPYRSSNKNAGFYGIAVEKNTPFLTWAAFYSDKYLTAALSPDGTAKSVPSSVNFSASSQDKFNYLNNMNDRSYGAYASFPGRSFEFYLTGYHEEFAPEIMPVERTETYWDEDEAAEWDETAIKYIRYKFSGDKNDVYGTGLETSQGNARFFFDYALSLHNAYSSNADKTKESEKAKAFQFAGVYDYSYTTMLFGFHRFDADYYNYHISGDQPVEKMFSEVKTKTKNLTLQWAGELWREVRPLKEITLKNFYKTYLQAQYPVTKKFKILVKYTLQNEDEKIKTYDTTDYIQEPKETDQTRVQLTWTPSSDVRIRWKYDTKKVIQDTSDAWLYSTGQAELKYRFSKNFQILSSVKCDKDPGAGKNKYTLFSIKPKMKFSKQSLVSMSFERKMYYHTPEFYNTSYGELDYPDDTYKYDGEDVLRDVTDKFEIKYTLKF